MPSVDLLATSRLAIIHKEYWIRSSEMCETKKRKTNEISWRRL